MSIIKLAILNQRRQGGLKISPPVAVWKDIASKNNFSDKTSRPQGPTIVSKDLDKILEQDRLPESHLL